MLYDDRDRMTEYLRCSGSAGGASANGSTTGNSATVVPPAATPAADPALAAQLAAEVQEARGQLPITQGPFTVTDVTSSGNELSLIGTLSVDIPTAQWSQFETELQRSNCSGSQAALIRRGAVITTQITDSAGETRSFTTASCPAA